MNYTNCLLFTHWINNTITNKVNDEILLIIYDTSSVKRSTLINKLEKSLELDTKACNYMLFDINEIDSIDKIKRTNNSTNIILLGNPFIEISKILDSNNKILISIYSKLLECNFLQTKKRELSLSEENIRRIINLRDKPKINEFERYENYIEKRDPLKIINSNNYNIIYKSIFSIFSQFKTTIFRNIEVLQSNKTTYHPYWIEQIDQDIFILLEYKILTSRLAVAIYKTSTLKFFDSTTKIGLFYRNKLGVKAKTTQLPNVTSIKKVKAYNLNKT